MSEIITIKPVAGMSGKMTKRSDVSFRTDKITGKTTSYTWSGNAKERISPAKVLQQYAMAHANNQATLIMQDPARLALYEQQKQEAGYLRHTRYFIVQQIFRQTRDAVLQHDKTTIDILLQLIRNNPDHPTTRDAKLSAMASYLV